MLPLLLPLIPTIIKAVIGTKGTPDIADAIGISINPKNNVKALLAATLTLLAYYGVKIAPEWIAFLNELLPYIGIAWTALFVVSKKEDK